ncbi:MAG: hypothetical protein ABW022_20225 [Actinoplanes sp.]
MTTIHSLATELERVALYLHESGQELVDMGRTDHAERKHRAAAQLTRYATRLHDQFVADVDEVRMMVYAGRMGGILMASTVAISDIDQMTMNRLVSRGEMKHITDEGVPYYILTDYRPAAPDA